MSAPLNAVHCSHEGSEICVIDDIYLLGTLCLCQYWSARLEEAQGKLDGTMNAKAERTMQLLIGHYHKLLMSCSICRQRLRA